MSEPSTSFIINNIEVKSILRIYPGFLSKEAEGYLQQLTEEELSNLTINLRFDSPIVSTHSSYFRYNDLFLKFDNVQKLGTPEAILLAEKEYDADTEELAEKITTEIFNDFETAVFISSKVKIILEPHINTLFFMCLSFYGLYWDTYGENFNGPIADYNMAELTFSAQPFPYRSGNQVKFLSHLLYDYYSNPNAPKELTFVAGGKTHLTEDPGLIDWIMKLIAVGNLPLSLGSGGGALSTLLVSKENMTKDSFLVDLKKLTEANVPSFVDYKRKVVRAYCLEINKLFSHYMGLPQEKLNGKRLKIYHNILKAFNMDDFSKLHRDVGSTKTNRPDKAENRLRALMKA